MKRIFFLFVAVFMLSIFAYSLSQDHNLKTIDIHSEITQSEMIMGNSNFELNCLIAELFRYKTSFQCLGSSVILNGDFVSNKSQVSIDIFGFA